MIKKSIIVVLGIIQNKTGKILLSLRNDPKFPGGHLKWDFIGGKNEMGETLEETLLREAKEESGLKVKIQKFLPKTLCKNWDLPGYFQHTLLFCYQCRAVSGKLKSQDKKIKALRWVTISEALKMDLIFSAREYLEFLKKVKKV